MDPPPSRSSHHLSADSMPPPKPAHHHHPSHYNNHINNTEIDPFGGHFSLLNAILATALFRCWHLIVFFTGWATMVVLINVHVHSLTFASTLLTIFGTVLGFVISYRTTASFERYNEGRRYWSSVVFGGRLLASTIWFHVPDEPTTSEKLSATELAELRTRIIIEKKSAINLIEAFAMALKHYLRGEESIYFQDLYHLVKHLPVYALPAGKPLESYSNMPPRSPTSERAHQEHIAKIESRRSGKVSFQPPRQIMNQSTVYPEVSSSTARSPSMQSDAQSNPRRRGQGNSAPDSSIPAVIHEEKASTDSDLERGDAQIVPTLQDRSQATGVGTTQGASNESSEPRLLPGWNPPPYAIFDVFPFSLLVRRMAARGRFEGKRAAKHKAQRGIVNHNIPLELTLYLSSYIATLQRRKVCDVPTTNTLLAGLNQLLDSLTGLERILTTPVPFSYSIHLWAVTTIYVALLPFQLWTTLKYLTIPATAISTFIFYGFIVAGEEIENPFGYDKNDLDLDHFTDNIIRPELHALTSRPMPEVGVWAFDAQNSYVFHGHGRGEKDVTPEEWLKKGDGAIREVLTRADPCE
ncbi:hypothetical protein FRB94_009136 [Tulasnella sp. JGI-2019a]|nr:hypothetical protein FRB94_009136 [Tulasnella sp. JGI-2019a]